MGKIFFISDLHLNHANIIKYCNRPFSSVEEMNHMLIRNWNSVVSDDDTIYSLGDFCLGNYTRFQLFTSALNGHKHFILGNHDHISKKKILEAGFESVQYELLLKIDDLNLRLMHHPREVEQGEICVFGHVHDKQADLKCKNVCVCVEKIGYKPIELNELLENFDFF